VVGYLVSLLIINFLYRDMLWAFNNLKHFTGVKSTYLLTCGAEPSLRCCQLCSHSSQKRSEYVINSRSIVIEKSSQKRLLEMERECIIPHMGTWEPSEKS
jgi:hypothetical protein